MGIYDRALVDMLLKSTRARPIADLVASRASSQRRRPDVSWSRRTRPASGWTCSWPSNVGRGVALAAGAPDRRGGGDRQRRGGHAVAQAARRRRGRLDAAGARCRPTIDAEEMPLAVVHEDRWLVVIDKPAGLVVHPAPGHEAGTLVNALLAHCRDLRGIGGELRPGIVHRIDKDTSGLLVVAKDDATMAALGAAFKAHTVERVYDALVAGKPPGPGGAHRHAVRARPARAQEVLQPGAHGQARGHQLAGGRALPGRGAHRGAARDRAHAPGARAHGGARLPAAGRRTYGRPPREPAVRADRRRAGAAGAARADAGVRPPGDGRAPGVRVAAAARHAGGAGGAARARQAAANGMRAHVDTTRATRRRHAELPLLRSPLIAAPFAHGFSTRAGGVSAPPFDSLNLGAQLGRRRGERRREPAPAAARRRRRAAPLYVARQVHGAAVAACAPATIPRRSPRTEADALCSDDAGRGAGCVRRRLRPGADRRPAHRRGRRRRTPAGAAPSRACCRRSCARWPRVRRAPRRSARRAGPVDRPLLLRGRRRRSSRRFEAALGGAAHAARRRRCVAARRARQVARRSAAANRLLLERAGVAPDAIDAAPDCTHCDRAALLLLSPRRRQHRSADGRSSRV